MSFEKQKTNEEIAVAAGAALDQEYTAYIDMHGYDGCGLQIEWTAGAGGGTLAFKVYASLQDDGTAAASCTYQDVTNDVFGIVTVTGDAIMVDDAQVLGYAHYVKLSATIANKDAATALTVYSKKKRLAR